MREKKPIAVTVLNAVAAAAADITLAGGKLTVTNLGEEVNLSDATSYEYSAYALGTASVKEYDFALVSFLANHQYRFAVVVPEYIAFHGGGQEANELIPIREYVVWTGGTVPTADSLRDDFITRINLDPNSNVSAASGGAGIIELTLTNTLEQGDFNVEAPAGTAENITTPFVAPSGTPAQVEVLAPGQSSATAEYDTYRITFNKLRKHNGVSGGFALFSEDVKIFLDSLDIDAGAFVTEMDAVLDGTHTPVADYLGV